MVRCYVGMLLMLAAIPSMPQNAQPIDGANAVLADSLLDNMVGHWKMSGKMMGKPAAHMSERYVAHWIDVFGGRFSETLGYGKRVGNEIDFVFEYPDGPFRTNFVWDAAHQKWHWQMTQKNAAGQWTSFADVTLSRSQ